MPTLSSQALIIATLVYSPSTGKHSVLEGDQTKEVSDDDNWIVITEAQLLKINGFVRAKWQRAFQDAARGRDTNPSPPNQPF
jgi:hypothetical protein